MARVNCDPYEGGHLFALVNRVTCLFDREDEVMAAVRALEEDGVAPDDIDVFVGEQGARCLDLSGSGHGRAVRLLRSLEDAMADMGETNRRIDDALRRGATLLCVKLHKKPLIHQDDNGGIHIALFERLSDEKARALRVLKAVHAHDIHYWGPWSVEDVPSA
jgi:hypothetical protein